MPYSLLRLTPPRPSFLFHFCSAALRKLEAKRRNVEGKLERPGIVRHYTDSKRYVPWTHRNTFTNKNTHNNEFKSFYIDTYEGLNLNAFGQIEFNGQFS